MDPRQTSKRPRTTTEVYDKNAKQREMYRDMPTVEKNALLLQRSLKKREATTTRLLPNTNSVNPVEPLYVGQDNLDVGCSSSISKTVAECDVVTAPTVLQKGKEVAHPFRSFENGSTSGTSNAAHAPTAEKVSIATLYFGLFLLRCCVCLSLYALQVFSPTDGVLLSNCFILSKKITKTQYFRIRNRSTYSSAGFVVSNIANGRCNNQ